MSPIEWVYVLGCSSPPRPALQVCLGEEYGYAAMLALYLLVVGAVWMLMQSSREGAQSREAAAETVDRDVVQKILVTYCVTLSSVGDLKARGPALVRDMAGWAAPVAGGLSAGFYPVKCSLGLSFYEQTTGTVLIPVLLLGSFVVMEGLRVNLFSKPFTEFKHNVVTCAVLVAYLLYPSVVEALLRVFLCYGQEVEGHTYLLADLSRLCYDSTHTGAVFMSTVVLALYALGLPAFILLHLRVGSPGSTQPELQFLWRELGGGLGACCCGMGCTHRPAGALLCRVV